MRIGIDGWHAEVGRLHRCRVIFNIRRLGKASDVCFVVRLSSFHEGFSSHVFLGRPRSPGIVFECVLVIDRSFYFG